MVWDNCSIPNRHRSGTMICLWHWSAFEVDLEWRSDWSIRLCYVLLQERFVQTMRRWNLFSYCVQFLKSLLGYGDIGREVLRHVCAMQGGAPRYCGFERCVFRIRFYVLCVFRPVWGGFFWPCHVMVEANMTVLHIWSPYDPWYMIPDTWSHVIVQLWLKMTSSHCLRPVSCAWSIVHCASAKSSHALVIHIVLDFLDEYISKDYSCSSAVVLQYGKRTLW